MPALAMDSVCCSITSCSTDLKDKITFAPSTYFKSGMHYNTWITKEYTEPGRLIVEVTFLSFFNYKSKAFNFTTQTTRLFWICIAVIVFDIIYMDS